MEPVLASPPVVPGATSTAAGAARPLSVAERQGLIGGMARLLGVVQRLAMGLMETMTVGEARLIFVSEQPVVIVPLAEHARRPRGVTHPMVTLVKLAVSSVRLLERVLRMDESTTDQEIATMEGFVQNLQGMAAKLGLDPNAA